MKKKFITTCLSLCMTTILLNGCSASVTNDSEASNTASTTEEISVASNEETTSSVADDVETLTATESEASDYVTLTNMDITYTYESVPEKIVVLSYDTAEILAALGLADRIIGLAPADSTLNDVLPIYQQVLENVPIMDNLANGVPNLESVLALEPDFVYGASYSFMEQNAGNAQDYINMGIPVYGSTGTYSDTPTLEDTYTDILNIGKIFHVSDKAEAIVQDLQKRVDSITASVDTENKPSVFVYDSDEDAPYTAGGTSLESQLISIAGGINIYENMETDFATVAWEDVITANPDFIVINSYGTDEDVKMKIDFLKSLPELAEITAIKNDNFIVVSILAVFPSLQNVDVIETLANGFQNN